MKKIVFPTIIVCLCVASYTSFKLSESKNTLSEVQISNVEALVSDESGCHFTNGYRAFKKGGGGGYDCCQVWREKEPNKTENCN